MPASASDKTCSRDDVWIVIAAFNEETRLPATLQQVADAGWKNVAVIDDGSTDGTYDVAQRFPVWRLRHPVNCGKGATLKTGIEFVLGRGARIVATLDADGQHLPCELESLVQPILNGQADVTIGSRFLGRFVGMPYHRWMVLKLAAIFTRLVSGICLTDPHNGFRVFSAESLQRMHIMQPRFAYASEIVHEIVRLRLRLREVPVTVTYTDDTLFKGQRSLGALKISTDLLAARWSG